MTKKNTKPALAALSAALMFFLWRENKPEVYGLPSQGPNMKSTVIFPSALSASQVL